MTTPTVSIILSAYNSANTLERALKSITAQTFADWELVTINDSSTDDTKKILSSWQKKIGSRMHVITNKTNRGLTKSLNRGLAAAQGKYIARLDADDWWESTKLAKQVAYAQKHPNCGIVGTWYINHRGHRTTHVQLPQKDKDIKQQLFRRNPFGHSCVLIKKALLTTVGGYNEKLRYGQDLDLWFRLMPLATFHNLPEFLCHRSGENFNKREQTFNHIKTTAHYIHKYNAPLLTYFYLFEPIALLLTPFWLRRFIRRIGGIARHL